MRTPTQIRHHCGHIDADSTAGRVLRVLIKQRGLPVSTLTLGRAAGVCAVATAVHQVRQQLPPWERVRGEWRYDESAKRRFFVYWLDRTG